MEKRQEAWEIALDAVAIDGKRALARNKAKWLKDQETAMKEGKEFRRKEPTFVECERDALWWTLRDIRGVEKMIDLEDDDWMEVMDRRNRENAVEEADEEIGDITEVNVEQENGQGQVQSRVWNTVDLYHGLVPKFLAEEWATLLKTSKSTATFLVSRFVERVEDFGKIDLWKERCRETVEWERTQGITKAKKRGGVLKGGIPQGFEQMGPRRERGLNNETRQTADLRFLQHLQGRTVLNAMERGRRIEFILTRDLD